MVKNFILRTYSIKFYLNVNSLLMMFKVNNNILVLLLRYIGLILNIILDDPAFTEVIRQAEAAIDAGVNPTRIYQVQFNYRPSNGLKQREGITTLRTY